MKQATICYCLRDGQILLGMKKIRFGAGKWNGFGGKVDAGETNEEAAARELFEESGIATDPESLEKIADIKFYFGDTPVFQCHAYVARAWEGEPMESDEMSPQWFAIDQMPFDTMWVSDSAWLLPSLKGEHVQGIVHFDEAGTHVVQMELGPAKF